jgi:hypothetical protein
MSRKYTAGQFADPAGIIVEALARQGIFGFFAGVPTANINGYLPGSIAVDITNGNIYRNSGTITAATWVQVNAGVDLSGLLATAAEINRTAQNSTRSVQWTGAGAITQALHDGKTVMINNATGFATTLPAPTGSGARYRFVIQTTITGGNMTVASTGANIFGSVIQNTDTANGTSGFQSGVIANAAGITTITLDGTTKGGRKGDWFEIYDDANGIYIIRGNLNASGTEATPFS